MLFEFFKKLNIPRWLSLVGTAIFIIFPVIELFRGNIVEVLVALTLFFSMFAGIIIGKIIAAIVTIHLLKRSDDFGRRLSSGGEVFGFLLFPALVASMSNAYLNTNISMESLFMHFLIACFGDGIFFCVSPTNSKN